jgi:hypothetical protein
MNAPAALPESYRNEKDAARRREYATSDGNKRRRRKLYQAAIPKVSKKEFALILKDPNFEKSHKRPYVVCRWQNCREKHDILKGKKGGHLWERHRITVEKYLEDYPGAPLVSSAFRKRKARQGRKPKTALRGHSRPNLKIRGHAPNEKPLNKSQLAPLLALGFSYAEIGKRVNRFFTTIQNAVKRMGLQPATKEDRQMLAECRAFLRDHPQAGIGELKDWLAEQTMLRNAHNGDGDRCARFSALDLGPLFAVRGLRVGMTLGDTSSRLTVAASLGGMTPAQMAPHLYPLQGVKDNARHNATVFLGRNKAKIERERLQLDALSEAQRNVRIEAAKQALRTKS